ncbi:hypothetical protein EI555_013734 [Monodon monoceros]|uniref:Uncharacterized protein n=1 Tax=Monodon monoceros TaxID=40151 RepID=A0A4U1EQ97_MONMO|nr:hypothetical protein EI555_013734 [Monodon monoceros]
MLRDRLPWCRRDIGSDEWFGRNVDPTPGPLQEVQSTLWRTGHSWKLGGFDEQPNLMNPAKTELSVATSGIEAHCLSARYVAEVGSAHSHLPDVAGVDSKGAGVQSPADGPAPSQCLWTPSPGSPCLHGDERRSAAVGGTRPRYLTQPRPCVGRFLVPSPPPGRYRVVPGGPWSTALVPGWLQVGCGNLGSAKALVPAHPLVLAHSWLSSAHLCRMCGVSAPVCRALRCRKGANYDAASLPGGAQASEESHTLLNEEVSWANSHVLAVGPGHVRVKWGSSPRRGFAESFLRMAARQGRRLGRVG